jgi:hypothetical protein
MRARPIGPDLLRSAAVFGCRAGRLGCRAPLTGPHRSGLRFRLGWRGEIPPLPALSPDFFRAISAGECLVVSTVALCGAKLNSLTQLGSVVLPLLKITM